MTGQKDFTWVDETSARVDDIANLLSEEIDEEALQVEEISYGPDDIFQSSETYLREDGVLTDAESPEEICQYIPEINLGRIEFTGPAQYPSTTYHLDYNATEDGRVWKFESVDANRDLEAQNNYVRKLEDEIERRLQENEFINRVTESYQSDSETFQRLANNF